jgi:hypothetical protein
VTRLLGARLHAGEQLFQLGDPFLRVQRGPLARWEARSIRETGSRAEGASWTGGPTLFLALAVTAAGRRTRMCAAGNRHPFCDDPPVVGVVERALRLGAAVCLACLACAACEPLVAGPGHPPTEEPAPAGDVARSVCEAGCAHAIRCEGPRAAAACHCGHVQETGVLRSDWARAEVACLGRAACAEDDAAVSACEREALGAVGAAPLAPPAVVMECLERGSECGGSSVTCRRLAAMTDVARAEASACCPGGGDSPRL